MLKSSDELLLLEASLTNAATLVDEAEAAAVDEADDERERERERSAATRLLVPVLLLTDAATLLSSSAEMGVPSRFLCVIMCCFMLPLVENPRSQMAHLNGLSLV